MRGRDNPWRESLRRCAQALGLPLEASKNGILATDETRICTDQMVINISKSV